MRSNSGFIRATFLVLGLGTRLDAQQLGAAMSVVGGSATDVLGTTSRAVTLSPSLTLSPDPRLLLSLDASATRFENRQWSLGGGASGATRVSLGGPVALTLNAGAAAMNTSYDFSYITASGSPALEVSAGPVSAFAGVSAAAASTRLMRDAPPPPTPFGVPSLPSRTAFDDSRSSHGAVFGANLRLPGAGGETALAGVREEHSTVDTISFVDRSASLSVWNGGLTVSGNVGMRTEPGARTTFGSGALSIAVNQTVAVNVNAGSYPANHLIGTPAGRFVNLGLSMRTGRASVAGPKADGVPSAGAGMTRLAFRDDDATRVDVAGDFTNWKPIAARRAPNGVWFVDLNIPPGQYRYAFRVDGAAWKVPGGAAAVDDDFGGKSAWLTVSGTPSSSVR